MVDNCRKILVILSVIVLCFSSAHKSFAHNSCGDITSNNELKRHHSKLEGDFNFGVPYFTKTEFFYRVYFNSLKESSLVNSEKKIKLWKGLGGRIYDEFFELFQRDINEENKVKNYMLDFPECSLFPNTFLNKFKNFIFNGCAYNSRSDTTQNNEFKRHSLKLEGGFSFCIPSFDEKNFLEFKAFRKPGIDKISEKAMKENLKEFKKRNDTSLPFTTELKLIYTFFINPWLGLGGGIALNYNVFFLTSLKKKDNDKYTINGTSIEGMSEELFFRTSFNFLKDSRFTDSGTNLNLGGYLDLGYMINSVHFDPWHKRSGVFQDGTQEWGGSEINRYHNFTFGLGLNGGYKKVYLNVGYRGICPIGGMVKINREEIVERLKKEANRGTEHKPEDLQIEGDNIKGVCKFIGEIEIALGYDFWG